MRSIVNPAPVVVDQSVAGSFAGLLRLPAQAEEHPKPVILCWRLEMSIVISEDCAAPPPHVPDPPSTPTVCTVPPSAREMPPSSPPPLDPLSLPDLDAASELAASRELDPLELEPLPDPDEPLELAELPELDPLELATPPELDPPAEPETAASFVVQLPVVELLPHAPATTARHARHPFNATHGRTLLVVLPMAMIVPNFQGLRCPHPT